MKATMNYNGIPHALYSDGVHQDNGTDLKDTSTAAPKLSVKLRTRSGSESVDGQIVKTKRSISILYPTTNPITGVVTINVGRFELEVEPNMTDIDIAHLRNMMSDAILSASSGMFNQFLNTGNVDTDVG